MATVVRALIAGYRRHMEAEETVVFPAALANLGEADWNEVEAKLAARQDPLFGERGEKRFAALVSSSCNGRPTWPRLRRLVAPDMAGDRIEAVVAAPCRGCRGLRQ